MMNIGHRTALLPSGPDRRTRAPFSAPPRVAARGRGQIKARTGPRQAFNQSAFRLSWLARRDGGARAVFCVAGSKGLRSAIGKCVEVRWCALCRNCWWFCGVWCVGDAHELCETLCSGVGVLANDYTRVLVWLGRHCEWWATVPRTAGGHGWTEQVSRHQTRGVSAVIRREETGDGSTLGHGNVPIDISCIHYREMLKKLSSSKIERAQLWRYMGNLSFKNSSCVAIRKINDANKVCRQEKVTRFLLWYS